MQVSFRGQIKRKTGELAKEKDAKKKETLTKEIRELRNKLDAVNQQAIQMEGERKKSKKPSKKASKTEKKLSKKPSKKPARKTSRKSKK
jgi:septal ring factor EnvC (AmiA/AmiB activator)